jgi:hypothetical protein
VIPRPLLVWLLVLLTTLLSPVQAVQLLKKDAFTLLGENHRRNYPINCVDPAGLLPLDSITNQIEAYAAEGNIEGIQMLLEVNGVSSQQAGLARVALQRVFARMGDTGQIARTFANVNTPSGRALREFFGTSLKGAQARALNFSIPCGLNEVTLRAYGYVAKRMIELGLDQLGVQAARLALVNRALQEMGLPLIQ